MSSVSPDDIPIIRQSPLSRFRSSTLLILIVVCSAVFTDIFLYGLLVPVLPFALTSRAGVPVSEIPRWNGILLALYNLGLCIGSPAFGFLADRMSSRRLPFLAGLVALAASTLLLCLGRNVAVIAVGRVLQGLSAAICWAVGLALLADSLTERVGWALGWVNWAMTAGFLLSPILGGLAYENAGYYAVYYMAFGLIACDIVLRLFMKEGKAARTQNANVTDEGAPSRETRPVEADLVEPTHERPGGRSLQAGAGVANYWALIKSRRLLASLIGCIMQSASKSVTTTLAQVLLSANAQQIRILRCHPPFRRQDISLGCPRRRPHLSVRSSTGIPVSPGGQCRGSLRHKMAILCGFRPLSPTVRVFALRCRKHPVAKGTLGCAAYTDGHRPHALQHASHGGDNVRH